MLQHLTVEDVIEEAEATVHRYSKEPVFSRTGMGWLRPETPQEKAKSIKRAVKLQHRLEYGNRRAS